MGKMATIASAREIDALFRSGRRASHPLLSLIAAPAPARAAEGRLAIAAGKRLGGAVIRNRSKRVLREAARRAGGPWHGYDVVLIASPATGTASAADLDKALVSLLRRVEAIA